jgi:hypothetical protein
MKGSITFRFGGGPNDYRVLISRQGELDSGDLEVIAALINEDIKLKESIEAAEITRTSSYPTGGGKLRDTWSN